MDPNACLERIERWLQKIGRQERASHSCKQKFKQELDIACEDLATWLHKGGFDPEWEAHLEAAGYFKLWNSGLA
jgi:hypothetical protein